MTSTRNLILFPLIFFLVSCLSKESKPDSNARSEKSDQIQSRGDCFAMLKKFIPKENFKFVKYNIYNNTLDSTFHYSACDSDGTVYLKRLDDSVHVKSIIDFGEFWMDRKNVYYKYTRSDGVEIMNLHQADRSSFRTYGKTVYARDNKHVFDSRHGIIEEADLASFRPINLDEKTGMTTYARDKDNYFFWDDVVEDTLEFKELLKLN